ncbi:DUF84 family protein [Fredinandcohnia quinoae]|uniref:Probable inosine/xanthosine triphosphatase n=1 Tax=Fredinandcohnia quinoae TaxID=2918902 RepID=A0AAW5DXF5_9BACI|nr:DUF84 family protein [Fredinandcohnia sp. SECRCQ15]MCH1625352.1 DUF84 family protein [Fredinandcohnia sp. SECRCQ15]
MLNIAIGTKNPTKVAAIKLGFQGIDAHFIETSVPSGVSAQPLTDKETIQGAINRARNSLEKENTDIGIGLEGGVFSSDHGLFLCNWGAIVDGDKPPIIAGGARILLPEEVANGVRAGKELSEVMEEYTKQKDVRSKEGAIGIFTNGYVNRTDMFTHVVKLLVGQYTYRMNNW